MARCCEEQEKIVGKIPVRSAICYSPDNVVTCDAMNFASRRLRLQKAFKTILTDEQREQNKLIEQANNSPVKLIKEEIRDMGELERMVK